MATSKAKRRSEAAVASNLFHLAMLKMGFDALLESDGIWDAHANQIAQMAPGAWMSSMLGMVSSRRVKARKVGVTYYRFVRALHTGSTVSFPEYPGEPGGKVTLNSLRDEFTAAVEDVLPGPTVAIMMEGGAIEEYPSDVDDLGDGGNMTVLVEDIGAAELVDEDPRLEESLRQDAIRAVAIDRKQYRDDERQRSIEERQAIAKQAAREAKASSARKAKRAAKAAAARRAEKRVMDGSRGMVHDLANRDQRAKGFVRVSRTGTPCGWCAMLISRGAMFYKSAKSGGGKFFEDPKDNPDAYHDNDKCYAEPVFSIEQYNTDPRFDLNRQYAKDWPRVTKGYGGQDAINAWRRWIDAQKRNQTSQVEAVEIAQEA